MNTEKKYKQGERIYFVMGDKLPSGWGNVCGMAGPIIIIELEEKIKGYDYTHTYIVDKQIVEPPIES